MNNNEDKIEVEADTYYLFNRYRQVVNFGLYLCHGMFIGCAGMLVSFFLSSEYKEKVWLGSFLFWLLCLVLSFITGYIRKKLRKVLSPVFDKYVK